MKRRVRLVGLILTTVILLAVPAANGRRRHKGGHMQQEEIYQIRVKGHLAEHWAEWFDGFSLRNEANGEATLHGPVAD